MQFKRRVQMNFTCAYLKMSLDSTLIVLYKLRTEDCWEVIAEFFITDVVRRNIICVIFNNDGYFSMCQNY